MNIPDHSNRFTMTFKVDYIGLDNMPAHTIVTQKGRYSDVTVEVAAADAQKFVTKRMVEKGMLPRIVGVTLESRTKYTG